ncbi:hypothetical protein BGZ58_002150 [Dissophora ornata]|nr:hypothetical protein BGZ58_002150 [Dissophora ornata]
MHPTRIDAEMEAQGVISDLVTIASAGTHSHAFSPSQSINSRGSIDSKDDAPPQTTEWLKIIADRVTHLDAGLETTPVSVGNLVWYSTTMDPTTAALIQEQRHAHQIKYLIPDLPVQMYGRVQRHPPSWGLDRIDQRTDKLDGLYHYPESAGQNVTIYVIDTGVNIDHKDFDGRAQHGPVFLPGTDDSSDKNGHGTFVAALAAGSTYGVAKKAQIISLKALDDAGAGRLSNVLAAIEWVVKHHISQGSNARSIINLSLGAERNEPTNEAIQEAMRLGVHFSIAAGNDGKDACQISPASTPGAMTVGATDQDDTIASYSNWGPCVAIYAPGSDIVSAWAGSDTATHLQSGTSMASPHVAGLMALLLSESLEENIPARTLADMILKTVTKFSLNGQLVTDTIATSAGIPLSISASEEPLDSEGHPQLHLLEFHGKALASNLVYVGGAPATENETDIEDPPAAFSSVSSSKPASSAMGGILFTVAFTLVMTL